MKKVFLSIICFFSVFSLSLAFAECKFTGGDIATDFKNCNPSVGIHTQEGIDLNVSKSGSDFRTITADTILRVQKITAILAIAFIVIVGLTLVLPVSAEAKESAKSKVFSVLMGFLVMISATFIINGIINFLYEILK